MKKIPTKAIRNKIWKRAELQANANSLQNEIEEWFREHTVMPEDDLMTISGCCLYTEEYTTADKWEQWLDKFEEEQNGTKGTNN